ncbi:hypothetical protein K469DRAFT_673538, partial [Zopfia rhizophila CBS 207.26]
MAPLRIRAAAPSQFSSTALAAVLTGVGIFISGLLIGLVVLLVRAVRTHKRLLADLEERGVVIAQSQAHDPKRGSLTKPRAMLRRNMILPFNSKSGWGALPSVETINPPKPPSIPPHYAPPKPAGSVPKASRLSWPFSAHRASGKAVRLKKIRVPTLSTVIESPKPSSLVPILSGSLGGDSTSPRKSRSRQPSDQSLTTKSWAKAETLVRPNRSKSVAHIPISATSGMMSRISRPKLHARSASMCSQSSGNAPDAPTPLPLEVVRIKSEARRRSLLDRSPSRFSISSFESAGSSILVTQSSPILPRSNNVGVQKISKRDWRSSLIVGPRAPRDTASFHGNNQRSQSLIKSSVARYSLGTPSTKRQSLEENRSSTPTNSSSPYSIGKIKIAESV